MAQTDRQTHIQTDGHGDSMTNSAQRDRVVENEVDQNLFGVYKKDVQLCLSGGV